MEENREKNIVMMKRVGRKRKQSNSTTDDDVKRWSDLPNELLETIKKRLFYEDQFTLSEVCKSWSYSQEEERNRIPPILQMPWLLVFDDETDSCKLVDSKYNKTYTVDMKSILKKMNISNFDDVRVHESKYGWLLMSLQCQKPLTTRLFLYSPFFFDDEDENNRNFIELPSLCFKISFASFSSNPLDDDDCTIVTLNTTLGNAILVSTCGSRGHSSWSNHVVNCGFMPVIVRRWMYSEGIFYYTTYLGRVGTFDFAKKDWNVLPSPPLSQAELAYATHYIVKSNDKELFLIMEESLSKPNQKWVSSKHSICRLDLLSMVWEKMRSIDDRVLFIGDGYNCVLNSSVLKLNGERRGISDTIYYCSGKVLKYCTVHDFIATNADSMSKRYPRQSCAKLYGLMATKKQCKKMLIDPPLSSSLHRAS